MLYYDRIDVSEGIDINKTSASKECDICHNWDFLDKWFKFKPYIDNRCHDVLMMPVNLKDSSTSNKSSGDYRCAINGITKSAACNLLKNSDLSKKGMLWR